MYSKNQKIIFVLQQHQLPVLNTKSLPDKPRPDPCQLPTELDQGIFLPEEFVMTSQLTNTQVRENIVYHNQYLTTMPLIEKMHNRGLPSTGSIMLNRIPDRSSLKLKDDKKMVRDDSNHMVKWKVVKVCC
ncbi:hypothetical protein EVAR_87154_1 [Eumeta japonica]|uniref:Uncharacterized protein n=1 Tax=Eumeta variegata TaxID=151549 RepID=A0A4C1VV29_EUMVA|nr:hypothetical protein EVAR_87154_1 [Eumeta japonica]